MSTIEKRHSKIAFSIPPAVEQEVPLPITRLPQPTREGDPEPTFPGFLPIVIARGGERTRGKLQLVSWDEDVVDYHANRDEDLSQGGHVYNYTPDTQWGEVRENDTDAYGLGYGGGESVPAK